MTPEDHANYRRAADAIVLKILLRELFRLLMAKSPMEDKAKLHSAFRSMMDTLSLSVISQEYGKEFEEGYFRGAMIQSLDEIIDPILAP